MPTYQYRCSSCEDTIEVFQSFSARSLRKHAECGGELTKVISAAGIIFKGSGFYATDSRGAQPSKTSRDEQPSKSDSRDEQPSKSDSRDEQPSKSD